MKGLASTMLAELLRHLRLKYVVVPLLTPLFLAGAIPVICIVCLVRKESIYPTSAPWGMREPLATAALAALCIGFAAPYFAWVWWMRSDTIVMGYSRQFWRVLMASTFGAAVVLSAIFAGLMLIFCPE
jgi:hypothetical protein